MTELVHEFSPLYGVEKNGKTKIWLARVYTESDKAIAHIEYGQIDGKKQTTQREYTTGKNVGKKNETTPLQQCMAETKRKWQDKQEKENYTLTLASTQTGPPSEPSAPIAEPTAQPRKVFPMLAHKYEPNTDKQKRSDIVFPCYVQPKLDGLRCVLFYENGRVIAQSRTGSRFETMEHICSSMEPVFRENPTIVFDGELYTQEIPFEELAGLIKKKKIGEKDKQRLLSVKYHIYDIVADSPFETRYKTLQTMFATGSKPDYIEIVPTQITDTKDAFYSAFGEYIKEGYEGIMLRNAKGAYRENYRSHDLQKYKEFVEDEYPIIGYKEADGRDRGTVIWVCKTKEGREFNVRPRGTMDYRRQMFADAEKYIGKMLTVIYQELSEQNVPRFPVGKAIRENY